MSDSATTLVRVQATPAQLASFEHQCKINEGLLAGTLMGHLGIEPHAEMAEQVIGWLRTARCLGVAAHIMSGIRAEVVTPAPPRPRVVCLCGSTRFVEHFRSVNLYETLAGRIVLSIGCDTKSDADLQALGELTDEAKAKLDELHLRKIDLADEILVLNHDDYIGDSTRREIAYARAAGKRVRWMCPTQHSAPGDVAG